MEDVSTVVSEPTVLTQRGGVLSVWFLGCNVNFYVYKLLANQNLPDHKTGTQAMFPVEFHVMVLSQSTFLQE